MNEEIAARLAISVKTVYRTLKSLAADERDASPAPDEPFGPAETV